MPETLIRHPESYPERWARIERGALRWVEIDRASAFPDEQGALLAYAQARAALLSQAQARFQRAAQSGALYTPRDRSEPPRPPRLADYGPEWLFSDAPPPLRERASPADFAQGLELWFARCPEGWLSESSFQGSFTPEFHQARPFFSRQAALEAVEGCRFKPRGPVSLTRARLAFNQVASLSPDGGLDPLAASIAASCEASELSAALESPAASSPPEPVGPSRKAL